jgi:S-adenosyl methyltransferase
MTHDPAPDKGRKLDTSVAYSARLNNYFQGGKDNFAADREAAKQAFQAVPDLQQVVQSGIRFRARAIRYLVREEGIRQFLDLGTGLPAGDPVHKIAQAQPQAQDSHVVYVDNDPLAICHAQAQPAPPHTCGYVEADVRDTETVLAKAADTLDFAQPVALILSALLHLIPDANDPYGMVRTYLDAAAANSCLIIVHPSSDMRPEASAQMAASLNSLVVQQRQYRDHAEVTRFFDGLDLLPPGVVPVPRWRPDDDFEANVGALAWCGIARKP